MIQLTKYIILRYIWSSYWKCFRALRWNGCPVMLMRDFWTHPKLRAEGWISQWLMILSIMTAMESSQKLLRRAYHSLGSCFLVMDPSAMFGKPGSFHMLSIQALCSAKTEASLFGTLLHVSLYLAVNFHPLWYLLLKLGNISVFLSSLNHSSKLVKNKERGGRWYLNL